MDKYFNHNKKDIICSDGEGVSLSAVQNKYVTLCEALENKPIIFYMDCCRGLNLEIDGDKIKCIPKGPDPIYINSLSDIYIHDVSLPEYSSYANIDPSQCSFFTSALYPHYFVHIYKYGRENYH